MKHIEMGIGYKIPENDILGKKTDHFYCSIIEKRFKKNFVILKNNYEKFLVKYGPLLLEKVLNDFGMDFTYNSNKIEGSTLNRRESWLLLKENITPNHRKFSDALEIYTHMKVYNLLLDSKEELSMKLILKWHELLYKETKHHAGTFRDVNVGIWGSDVKFPDYQNVISLMKELIDWYNRKKEVYHPVLLAGLFKFKFVNIHPFQDGNGRMSRLLMNYLLYKNGHPMLNIEYIKRKGYYTALERSNLQKNELIFVNWFFKYYMNNDYFSYYYGSNELK
ncbi:Fic family protein [Promethearchaeum syntrophicum]|uniref:Fic family protein n=1 Tax=Promethearchaeum syntrophicum TaxID=2594042 RepID=A0A5B9DC56_9ARCH|nr:Fic family protein [Candidatus Prometheoarchaeum syntrophicum]